MLHGQNASNPNQHQNQQNLINQSGIDITGKYPSYKAAQYLTAPEYESLVGQYAFQLGLQPHEQDALMQMMGYLSNPQNATNAFREQAQAGAQAQMPQLQQDLLNAGAGSGVGQGLALHAANQANRESNSFAANQYSGEGIANRAQGIHNIFELARPNLGNLNALSGIQLQTPHSQTFGQQIGNVIGNAAGNIKLGK